MKQFQNHEVDHLAACYLFILDRMRERKKSTPDFAENSHSLHQPVKMDSEILLQPAPSIPNRRIRQPLVH